MKRGEDDGDGDDAGGVRPPVVLMPWWRSVGFWLGLWGLAFLVWVGVDSYTSVWRVVLPVSMEASRYRHTMTGKEMLLQGGRVMVGHAQMSELPAGVTLRSRKPRTEHLKGSYVRPETTWWGSRRLEKEAGDVFRGRADANPFAGMSVEMRQWWFPYGVVVLGYVVVWICLMRWWRWWMRRRWEREQAVEG